MNYTDEKIETFVVLGTVVSLDLVNRITAAFEDLGIPVLLEHIDAIGENTANAFRISTQVQFSENATRIMGNFTNAHDTKMVITSRQTYSS